MKCYFNFVKIRSYLYFTNKGSAYASCACNAYRGHKRARDPQDLELQMVVSCCVDAAFY